ncbi:FAD binding domain-containing protein [Pseudarthrobacter oxydans]|uniref:FAD binding domain-containing protein n=1 Tax=Pseudarthrobacter oxydans TaxID=1671 RepID=UPI003ECCADD5
MLPQEFTFHAPRTVEEALELLSGEGTPQALGGGMSLLPLINLGTRTATSLVSLRRIDELKFIESSGDLLRIGGTVTHVEIASNPGIARLCPPLADAASKIADVQVRNRGTIGGSLAHGYPGAEYPTVLSALGATAVLQSAGTSRELPVRDLNVGRLETVVRPDEIITEVRVPTLAPEVRTAYIRFARVMGNYSTVNVVALVRNDRSVTLGFGGAKYRPVVVESHLDADFEGAARDACKESYSDHMATAEYRVAMAGVLAHRAIDLALGNYSVLQEKV